MADGDNKVGTAIVAGVGTALSAEAMARYLGIDATTLALWSAAAAPVFQQSLDGVQSWVGTRKAVLWGGMLQGYDGDEERLKADLQDQTAQLNATMYATFRNMMDAVDERVIPLLGLLAARYTYNKKAPDRFFRGVGRTLAELTYDEVGELKKVCFHVAKVEHPTYQDRVILYLGPRSPNTLEYVRGEAMHQLTHLADATRLMALLERNDLVEQTLDRPSPIGSSGSHRAMPLTTARTIVDLLAGVEFEY